MAISVTSMRSGTNSIAGNRDVAAIRGGKVFMRRIPILQDESFIVKPESGSQTNHCKTILYFIGQDSIVGWISVA
jgi:hypothetical protein